MDNGTSVVTITYTYRKWHVVDTPRTIVAYFELAKQYELSDGSFVDRINVYTSLRDAERECEKRND